MTSGSENFVAALARASGPAQRYLRRESAHDREDILADAVLWCWENRSTYNLNVSMERWLLDSVRRAYRSWRAGNKTTWAQLSEHMAGPQRTESYAEVIEAAQKLVAALSPQDRKLAIQLMQGASVEEISKRMRISGRQVRRRLRRIQELRGLIPDSRQFEHVLRAPKQPLSDVASDELAPIDREIEQVEFAPLGAQDCTPCWRCKWFDGFMPLKNRRPQKTILIEPEVRAAVSMIEARKVQIAASVRDGSVFQR